MEQYRFGFLTFAEIALVIPYSFSKAAWPQL